MSNNFLKIAIARYKTDGNARFFLRALRFLIVTTYSQLRLQAYRLRFKHRYVIKTIHGSKMALKMDDKGMSSVLVVHGLWERLAVKMMEQTVRAGNVVVDIGANIGYYALLEARLVGEKGKVFAIEPVSENLATLKKNIELNGLQNIEVTQVAIGDHDKQDHIYLSDRLNQSSMIYRESVVGDKGITKQAVEVMTLDTFLKDKPLPDVMRMDVEGYEYEIIMGMKELLKTNKPLSILMELHIYSRSETKSRIFEMLDMLYCHGFEFKIGAWPTWESNSRLLTSIYNGLSKKIDPRQDEYFYANDLEGVKEIVVSILSSGKDSCPHVIFQRG